MNQFRVIITGAGSFDKYALLSAKCRKILMRKMVADTEVIILSSHHFGAEQLAEKWAKENHLKLELFPLDYEQTHRVAEDEQRKQMIDVADALIAFDWPPYPNWHMIKLIEAAKKKGIPVRTIG